MADFVYLMLFAYVFRDGARSNKQARSGLAEGLKQRAIVKFSDDLRLEPMCAEPLFQTGANHYIGTRQKKRGTVQRGRKFAP